MTSKQLQCFFAVAETLSYTRASEKLFLSQSVVTYQIKLLEEELGFSLFDRDKHYVRLTEAGSSYYSDMRYCDMIMDNARRKAEALAHPRPQLMKLGIGYSWDTNIWNQVILSCAIVEFRSLHPEIDIYLSYLNHAESSNPILDNEVDLQFVYSLDERFPPHLSYAHTSVTYDYCLVKVGDPLWNRRELSPGDLAGRTVFIPKGSEMHPVNNRMVNMLKDICSIEHTESFENSLIMVLSNMGAAMIPHAVLDNPTVRTIPVIMPGGPIQLGLAWQKKDENPLLLELVALLQKHYGLRDGAAK